MTTIYAIHAPVDAHLASVIEEMRVLGAPMIRAIDCGDYLMAIEGSHRLAAAAALELTPVFEIIAQDEEIDISGYDWFEAQNWDGHIYQAGEVAGELFSPRDAVVYSFDRHMA
jgi:ABC-type glycerol-3-phosphate transport system substrate-binding protein